MLGNGQQSGRPGRAIANSPFLRYLEYFGSFRFLFWNILDPFGLHAQATDSLRRKVDRREIEDTLNISTLYTVSGHTHIYIHVSIPISIPIFISTSLYLISISISLTLGFQIASTWLATFHIPQDGFSKARTQARQIW